MSPLALIVTVFLACAVEAVEALTVVLAAGTGRHWRSALQGAGAALLTLAALVGALGPAVARIPLGGLRVVIGTLLLLFGLQWLRKAVLRASGWKDRHDEAAAFAKGIAAAEQTPVERRGKASFVTLRHPRHDSLVIAHHDLIANMHFIQILHIRTNNDGDRTARAGQRGFEQAFHEFAAAFTLAQNSRRNLSWILSVHRV